jgi:hypothetical protein
MPTSDPHRPTAAIDHAKVAAARMHGAADQARRQTLLFMVASPRPQVGKTFVARLVTDYLRLDRREPVVFDLNPSGDALTDYLPDLATSADIGATPGQMALFDALIRGDGVAKVVDVGNASFERFFAIIEEIGFIREALRRGIAPIILYVADPHPVAVRAYADLQQRLPDAILVPVLNEATVKPRAMRDKFPFTRAAAVPLHIPALPTLLRAQLERPPYSFVDTHDALPMAIPVGLGLELQAWTRRAFLEFREFELRLLLEQLRASLPGVGL